MIYQSQFEPDVPADLQQKHKATFNKVKDAKFASKLLLYVLIPWLWLCYLSYLMIGYFDSKAETDKLNHQTKVLVEALNKSEPLAQSGNTHALIFLAEKGGLEQREKAVSQLKVDKSIEAKYYNDVIAYRTSDIPNLNLTEDQQYVNNIITYAKKGYSRALDDLVELERTILLSKSKTNAKKEVLDKINAFKISLKAKS